MPATMPLEAPVTMATFPLSLLIALRSLNLCCQFDVSTTIELMRWGGKGFGGFGDFLCGSVVPSGLIRWGLFTQDCVLGWSQSSLRDLSGGACLPRTASWANFFRPFGTS